MRSEVQPWNAVRVGFEAIDPGGAGLTGLTVLTYLRRDNGQFLQANGTSWGATAAAHTLSEVSQASLPGLYQYAVATAACAVTAVGYLAGITAPGIAWLEHVRIHVHQSAEEALRSAGRHANTRVTYTSWSSGGTPTAGQVLVYADEASALADVAPWTGALGSYDWAANVDGQDRVLIWYATKAT